MQFMGVQSFVDLSHFFTMCYNWDDACDIPANTSFFILKFSLRI